MGARNAVFACFLVAFVFTSYLYGIVTAAPKVRVSVDLEQPNSANVLVFVTPDEANKFIVVAIGTEDGSYGTSSSRGLNGAEDRTEHSFMYRRIPRGQYLAVASVFNEEAKLIAQGSKRFYR